MLVEMKNIVMEFGPMRAVDHVDFAINTGEIVGLLGENGAGKSTLMNILAGSFLPVRGEIFINGEKVHITNAKQAMRHGIRFIHQELNLCKDLKVFENMFLGEESKKYGLLNKKTMREKSQEVFLRMKVDIDPDALVKDLQASEKQLVEIARALLFKSDLIIMDEPSTALSNKEIENLFLIMRQLKQEGVSFIYISHKMPELFEICDRYYVMRDGKMVADGNFSEIDEQQITKLMIGRHLEDQGFTHKETYSTGEVVMSVHNISGKTFRNISFDLHQGEIIAVTGLQGSGRDGLADAIFGAEGYTGVIIVKKEAFDQKASILKRMKKGVAMVPRSRKERGILNDLSICDNISIGYFNTQHKSMLIHHSREKERYLRQKQNLSIKSESPKAPVTSLSGGNQQKVILGRWLESGADIFVFDNPTQGIDVGTKFEIYHLIIDLAKAGKSILVFSSEYPEIIKVADSCMVMYKGEMAARLDRKEITEEKIMYYSTGANREGKKNGETA